MGIPLPMADDDNEPDDTDLYEYDSAGEDAECESCHQPATGVYEDSTRRQPGRPWCGRESCGFWIQSGMNFKSLPPTSWE